MSFLSVLQLVNNDQLPNCSDPAQPRYLVSQSNTTLIPFYIHLIPEKLPLLQSNTTQSNSNIKPSNSPWTNYLTRSNSSDQLPHPSFENPIQSVYDIDQQTRDASQPIGFLQIDVIKALLDDNQSMIQSHCKPCWKFFYPSPEEGVKYLGSSKSQHNDQMLPCCVCMEDWINFAENRLETRNEHLDRLVRGWKESGLFNDQLTGWRNERYSVYGPKDRLDDENTLPAANVAFKIERAAVGLFGFLSFGAHLTAYIRKKGEYFFWIPTRSPNKPTWPSTLDNTVAGGITSGETSMETIIRESVEEASFPEEFVRLNAKSTGLISYTHRNQFGWIQPEIQYTFDLDLTTRSDQETIIPKPNDGETQNFKLMSTEEIFIAIKSNQFKPNCAAVLIDFFVRHGILNELNLNNFCFISTFLKRLPNLPLP